MLRLAIALSIVCLVVMILVDRVLGTRAEFLNAWSVVERMLGRPPTAGTSSVAQRLGSAGEFLVVIMANAAVGIILAAAIRFGMRLFR